MMEDKPCGLCGCIHHWEATKAMGGWNVKGELLLPDNPSDNPHTAAYNVPSEAAARIVGYNLAERLCLARRLAQQKAHTQAAVELWQTANEERGKAACEIEESRGVLDPTTARPGWSVVDIAKNWIACKDELANQTEREISRAAQLDEDCEGLRLKVVALDERAKEANEVKGKMHAIILDGYERAEAAEREREVAKARCAAYREVMQIVRDNHAKPHQHRQGSTVRTLDDMLGQPNPGQSILDRLKAAEKAWTVLFTACTNVIPCLRVAGVPISGVGVASADKVIAVVRKSLEAAIAATGKSLATSTEETKCPSE